MYVTVCDPCLDGRHDECLGSFDAPEPPAIGGGHCVCPHGRHPDTAFQRRVRQSAEAARRKRAAPADPPEAQ